MKQKENYPSGYPAPSPETGAGAGNPSNHPYDGYQHVPFEIRDPQIQQNEAVEG